MCSHRKCNLFCRKNTIYLHDLHVFLWHKHLMLRIINFALCSQVLFKYSINYWSGSLCWRFCNSVISLLYWNIYCEVGRFRYNKQSWPSVRFQAQYSSNMGYFTVDETLKIQTSFASVLFFTLRQVHFTGRVFLEDILFLKLEMLPCNSNFSFYIEKQTCLSK